jgi:hypothetical protein
MGSGDFEEARCSKFLDDDKWNSQIGMLWSSAFLRICWKGSAVPLLSVWSILKVNKSRETEEL